MRVRCFFLVVIAVFIAFPNPIYSQSQWRGYVLGTENYVEPDERVCDFVNQGVMMIPRSLSARAYYWTGFQMQDIFCIKNNFTFEIRLKNAARDGGIEAFDVGINLPGSSTTLSSNFVGIGWGQEYTSISIGNTTVANRPEFVLNLSDWATIKIELKDKRLRYYYNDRIIFTTNYNDDICYLRGFNIGFKGSGAVDWIRLSDENSRVIYFEDFLNCNSFARGCSDRLANRATPDILQENDELVSTSAETYQWYFNNTKILGATGQRHKPTQIGNYLVEVTDKCSPVAVRSQPFSVNAFPLAANLNLTISPETEQTASIGQTVRYAITLRDGSNQPVSAALVGVENGIARQTQSITNTNSNGQSEYSYTIPPNTAAGTYTLTFHANKSGTSLSASASRTIRVSASTTLPFATFISGRVKTPADIGVGNVSVRLNTGQTTTTEPDGTYIFRNIPIETNYTVSVDVPNSYRLLGSSRQVRIAGLGTFAQRQDFTIVRDAQQDELIKIYVIEKVPGMVKKVKLWGANYSGTNSYINNTQQPLVNGVATFTKDNLGEIYLASTFFDELNAQELYLLDGADKVIGKIGFVYKAKDKVQNRRKEVIVIFHNDLASYQQHPIEANNKKWLFANFYQYKYSTEGLVDRVADLGLEYPKIQSDLYQTTMLVPPTTSQGEYYLSALRPDKKPVIWIHGVTGTDGYWGKNNDIVDMQTETPENNFNGKKDYPFTSYTGRFQRLEWVKDNCDVWEYYYPPDQAWRDSGYLFSRDIKEVVSKYGNQPATIVAHSMGGLVTRSYIEETAENYLPNGTSTGKVSFGNDVDKVLFLGTPHHGSFGGTRLYWAIFTPGLVQQTASGKDAFAPANRELGIASMSVFELNNKSVLKNGITYAQISGTTWRGLIPAASNSPITIESQYHSDGIVSISSASLLNFNIPLILLQDFSHAHLNDPETENNLNLTQKQIIPKLARNFLQNNSTKLAGTELFDPANTSDGGLTVINKDTDYQIRTDITLPIVSFVNQASKKSWLPKPIEGGYIWNSGLRFKLDVNQNNQQKSAVLTGEYMGATSTYNDGAMYLYFSQNNFGGSNFKHNLLSQIPSPGFYGYEDNISKNPFDSKVSVQSQGVGWHLPLSAAPERKLGMDVHLAYKFNKPVTRYVQISPDIPGAYQTNMEEAQSYYVCKGKLNLQWCTTTYNNLEISDAAIAILESNQTLPNEIAGSIRPSSLVAQAMEQNNLKGQQSQLNTVADSLINYIDADTRTASFVLSYGRNREPLMEVVAPNGSIIRKEQANGTSILYHQDSVLQVKFFTIKNPERGKWAVRVNGVSALPDTSYRLSYPMNVGQSLVMQVDTNFLARSTDSTRLRVQLIGTTTTTMSMNNLQVSALFKTISGETRTLTLRDDGRNGDVRANDGTYTSFFAPKQLGTYTIGAYMTGQMNNTNFLRQAFSTIQVGSDSLQSAVAAEPQGFRLLAPQNRAQSISPTRIRFRWAAATQPIYNFQISTDTNFAYIPFNQFFTDTSVTITDFGTGRWYYWRVRPLGGEWSPVWSFYTGNLLAAAKAPNDGAALSSGSEPLRSFLAAANDDIINIINLKQHPNPFSHTTMLEYLLPREAHVRMDVCNMLGQTLITPVNGMETAGAHTVDVTMDGFPSGVYVVRMSVGGRVLTRQMTLIR